MFDDSQYMKKFSLKYTDKVPKGLTPPKYRKYLKKICRTKKELIRWIHLQKIRWTERNVLTQQTKNFKNQSNTEKIEDAL